MIAILAALGSSIAWGASDFIGGLQSRRIPTLTVLVISQSFGALLTTLAVAIVRPDWPGWSNAAWAAGAGVTAVLALAVFFRALATGSMSVVAPVSSTGTAIPVAFGLAAGEALTAIQATGIACAMTGVFLAGREPESQTQPPPRSVLWMALAAAVGFGLFFTFIGKAGAGGVLFAVFIQRVFAVLTLITWLAASRQRPDLPGFPEIRPLLGLGLLDLAANGLFAFAATRGALSVVAVLGSLYPLMTVLLAHLLLNERLAPLQRTGVGLTIAGVLALAGASG